MLIVKALVRIGFGGGGTDLPETCTRCGGIVVRRSIKGKAGPTPASRARLLDLRGLQWMISSPKTSTKVTVSLLKSHFLDLGGLVTSILRRALRKGMRTALPAVLVSLLINVFVAQAMVVQGPSMKPNLTYNQRVIVEKITYYFTHGPRRGDVVIVDMPGEEELLVKRAVALPGETVAVWDGQVFIDGQPLEEPWAIRRGGLDYPLTRVPPQHIFVLGDNREESRDSRFFGPVPVGRIGGRVRLIVWPPDRIGRIG